MRHRRVTNRTDSNMRPRQNSALQPGTGPNSMTIEHIIIHDARLEACFQPHGRTRLFVVNGSTPLSRIAEIIRNTANSEANRDTASRLTANRRVRPWRGSIPVLSFYAHGVGVERDDRGRDSFLEVGRELILSDNASRFGESFRGTISDKIRVLGCAIAATEYGRSICSRLAVGAQQRVYASSSVQHVHHSGVNHIAPERWVTGVKTTYSSSRFGRWQGTVYEFSRDGSHRIAWRNGDDIPRASPGGPRPNQVEEDEQFECVPNRNVRHI